MTVSCVFKGDSCKGHIETSSVFPQEGQPMLESVVTRTHLSSISQDDIGEALKDRKDVPWWVSEVSRGSPQWLLKGSRKWTSSSSLPGQCCFLGLLVCQVRPQGAQKQFTS